MRLRRSIRPTLTAAALTGGLLITAACSGDDTGDDTVTASIAPPPSDTETTTEATGDADATQSPEATDGPEPTDQPGDGDENTDSPDVTDEPADVDEPATVTIGATGDILPHARVIENGATHAQNGNDPDAEYDFSPMFSEVTELISEPDVSLCHLETPFSADNTNLTAPGVLVFNTPREVADALAGAGFDGCDFASNHAYDRQLAGIEDTARVLDDAGLEYAGPSPTEEDAGAGAWYEVEDITVAQLAYTYTLLNQADPNTIVPTEAPWLEHYLWLGRGADGIIDDAARAREDGADFVVLSMHWGAEYQAEPTADQQELATELLESGEIDLIIGSHVHVVQPCQEINGRYVLYGMGNFLSNQSPSQDPGFLPGTQDGMVAQVELNRDADGEISSELAIQPTHVNIDDHQIQLASPGRHADAYDRTIEALGMLGEDSCSFDTIED